MGASAGPNLVGIGRGGDSNLVLEMDAHDAKSYPGEPTSNIFYNPNNWTGSDWTSSSGTIANNAAEGPNGGSAGSITAVNADPYIYSGAVHSVAVGSFTFSCWVKGVGSSVGKSGDMRVNFSVGTATGSDPAYVNYTLTDQWQRVSILATATGAGTIQVGLEPPNSAAVGDVVYLADAQLEQKGYSTPFVREGKGGTGTYNARPASVNLIIHGNVGTGQNFSDSSPSKHTITANGDVTHSGAQSKFSGGSIYFDGTGDYLSMASSSEWALDGEFTIDFWVYLPTVSIYNDFIASQKYYTAGYNGNWVFRINSSNQLEARMYDAQVNVFDENSTTTLSADTWYHVAYTRDSNDRLDFWLDGTSIHNFTNSATFTSTADGIYVGNSFTTAFTGYLDEFRITKGTALWTSAFTPPTRRNLSAPVVDRSGNDNGGNFATTDPTDVVTYRDGQVIETIANAYWNFDGTDDSISLGGTTVAASDRPLNAYPFTFTAWVTSDNGWVSPSGMNELLNMNIAGQRVSLGSTVYSGWPTGPAIMYGGTSHWTCPSSAFGNPTGWTHIAFVIYGSNNSNHKIYINGVSQALTDNGLAHGGTAGWTLGSNSVSAEHWVGNIANAQLYNKTLTEAEVIENFNQQSSRFNPPNWGNNAIVQNGLDLWLDAGEKGSYPGTGSTWYDLTSNNYDGTIYNATYSGLGHGSFNFDGAGDKVDVGPITTAGEHSNCTISLWFNKIAQVATYGNLFDCNYLTSSANKGPRMEVDAAGSIIRVYMGTDGGSYTSVSFGSLSNSVWYNVVLTVAPNGTGQDLKTYTDGALVSSSTSTSSYVWDGDVGDLAVGVGFNTGRYFTGKIAAFTLYNRVLSADEIEQNFIVQKQRFGI
jgi:hypothetical protein